MTRDCGDFLPDSMKRADAGGFRQDGRALFEIQRVRRGRVRIAFSITNPMSGSPALLEQVGAGRPSLSLDRALSPGRALSRDRVLLGQPSTPPGRIISRPHHLLGPNLLAAHAVIALAREVKLMAERGVKPVHCTRSN